MTKNNSTLRIGYDAKRAMCNFTGLGNYSRYAIEAMSLYYPENSYELYTPRVVENARTEALRRLPNVHLHLPPTPFWQKMGALWRSLEMTQTLLDDDVAIYHGLSNELPLNIGASGLASVVTVHDVIWRRWPQDYSWIDRRMYDFKYGRSMRSASRIIAISERTKADIVNDFGIAPEKIDVIYQGIDPVFSLPIDHETKEAVRKKYALPEQYIVMVGTVQGRKNQLLAVKALRGLPKEVKLVVVGRRSGSYGQEVERYVAAKGLGDRVIWLEGVPFGDLPALYAMAQCAAYPSRYEGFGLPVVEALACGVPVIAATGSCLEEAGGKGAVYVDPDDVEAFVDAAKGIIGDSYRRNKMVELGHRHIKKFDAGEFAQQTMATYMKALFGN